LWKAQRAMQAIKIDLADLQRAYAGT